MKLRCAIFVADLVSSKAVPTPCIASCSPIACSRSCLRRILSPFRLGPLLERVALLEQRVPVQLDPGPPVMLNADPDQLEQMFINLLANAVDASLANGAKPVRIGWRLLESSVMVGIEDSGLGIANTENLFVPFYTTKPTGSGVGLALAQQIARAHGGEIRLLNRDDGPGARATIRLPVA